MATTNPQTKQSAVCETVTQGLSDDERAAWGGFLRAHSMVTKALEGDLTAKFGLQLSEWEVLLHLDRAEDGELNMSALAEAVLLSQSRISRLAAKLSERGLLERRNCRADTRVIYAGITVAGRKLVSDVQEVHIDGIRSRFLSELSPAEVKAMSKLWPKITKAAANRT